MIRHDPPSVSPSALVRTLWRHRDLITLLIRRESTGRYRGSFLGIAWSFFNPLCLLAVYTFVFSRIFRPPWAAEPGGVPFALTLFAGLLVLNLFNEILIRAPGLVAANVNFVKKVVFPLEIIPIVALGSALTHGIIGMGALLSAIFITTGQLPATAIFVPLLAVPLLLIALGAGWVLAAIGVFLRDTAQSVGLIATLLSLLTPVFYPAAAVPERVRPWLMANPLSFVVEQTRAVLIGGRAPDWTGLALFTLVGAALAWMGFAFFQRLRSGFADVL